MICLRYYHKNSKKVSIFHSHNYDGSNFRPIYMPPKAEERIDSDSSSGKSGGLVQLSAKLSNPFEYMKETTDDNQGQPPPKSSNNRKLSNPWELSNYSPPQASRPLPKYVVDAKKFFFDDYDTATEEIMLTKSTNYYESAPKTKPTKSRSRPISFPQKTHSHMRHVSFPSNPYRERPNKNQQKRRTDTINSATIVFNQPTITPKPFRLPGTYIFGFFM